MDAVLVMHGIAKKLRVQVIMGIIVGIALTGSLWTLDTAGRHSPPPVRPIPPHGSGFATSLVELSQFSLDKRLEEMRATGATWVRSDLSWSAVQEAGPASYKWQAYDRVVESANAHGLQTLFIIGFTPSWARPSNCTDSEMCAPASAAAYGTFAGAAAAHFAPVGVHSWEIWNEANISFRFHPGVDAKKYTDMLKNAYRSINAVDSSADIIAGGTAPSASDVQNLSPVDFLQALYDNGAQGYFTAVSSHPYTYPKTPDNSGPLDAWGQLNRMHEIMAAAGDGGKQIWLTEFGAPTNGPVNRPNEYVSEALQNQILTEAVAQWKKHSWSGPFFWYDYKDSGSSNSSSEHFFGLVRADGSRKPAYDVFIHSASQL